MPIRRCSGLRTRNRPPNDQKAWPPRFDSGSWSSSSTRRPARASSAVAVSPASPAPTTIASASIWLSNQATGPLGSQEVRSSLAAFGPGAYHPVRSALNLGLCSGGSALAAHAAPHGGGGAAEVECRVSAPVLDSHDARVGQGESESKSGTGRA